MEHVRLTRGHTLSKQSPMFHEHKNIYIFLSKSPYIYSNLPVIFSLSISSRTSSWTLPKRTSTRRKLWGRMHNNKMWSQVHRLHPHRIHIGLPNGVWDTRTSQTAAAHTGHGRCQGTSTGAVPNSSQWTYEAGGTWHNNRTNSRPFSGGSHSPPTTTQQEWHLPHNGGQRFLRFDIHQLQCT